MAVQDSAGDVHRSVPLSKVPHLVAGDLVSCEGSVETDLRITRLHPRTSVLERPDRRNQLKAVAANLSQLVVVSAVIPALDLLLIDQFCTVAEHANINPVIVINKSDLAGQHELLQLQNTTEIYAQLDYPTAIVNTFSTEAMAPLKALLSNHSSVLVGQSGVGKSSIVQQLLPDLDVRIGAISQATGIGSHTTTVSFRYELPDSGGVLIDSPGVRHFPLEHLSREQIASGYREIFAAAADCKFSDCSHQQEPGCKVKQAVEAGQIASERYRNYLRLTGTS